MELGKKVDVHFVLDVTIFLVLLYGVTIFVHLNGDDFMYGSFAHSGIVHNVWSYYHTGNGRFWINILDSALLWFDRYLYILVTPWIELAFVLLIAKNVQYIRAGKTDKEKEHVLVRICMVLFACLDVLCLRETVFWITGMMNYLFPAVVFLLAYYLFQKARQGEIHGWRLAVYYAVCFLSASSVEQFALMFVGMITLHHGYDILNNKKNIPWWQWISYAVSLVGLAFLLFAPGNFQRVGEQQMPSLLSNTWTLVYQNSMDAVAFPFLMMFSAISTFSAVKKQSLPQKLFFCGAPILILVVRSIPMAERAIILIAILLVWLIQFSGAIGELKRIQRPHVWFLCFVGLGSQIMLLISAIWGFRCMFSMYMVYIMLIALLLSQMEKKDCLIILGTGITAALHPLLTLILWSMLLVGYFWNRKQPSLEILSIAVRTCTTVSLLIMCLGYGLNYTTYQDNIKSTKEALDVITIKTLPYEKYSWYWTPFNEFHENYYRIYYGLEDQEIIYDLPEGAP